MFASQASDGKLMDRIYEDFKQFNRKKMQCKYEYYTGKHLT